MQIGCENNITHICKKARILNEGAERRGYRGQGEEIMNYE